MKMAVALIVLLSTACVVGPGLDSVAPLATEPHGARGSLRVGNTLVEGELIAATDTALIMLSNGAYRIARVRDVSFVRMPGVNALLNPHNLKRLRAISRFPNGVTPLILEKLLQSTGQTELQVIQGRR